MHLPGQGVGEHGDHAFAAEGHQGQGHVVLAGVDGQVLPALGGDPGGHGGVAAGLLHRHDIGVLGQLHIGGHLNIAAGAAGHVIEDAGHLHLVGDEVEALHQALLRGLVVIGGDQQQAVGPQFFGFQGQLDAEGGVVAAGAGDDRHPARHLLDDKVYDFQVLLAGHGGGFPCGAAGDDGVDLVLQLELHQPVQFLPGDLTGRGKGGDQGGARPGKDQVFLHGDSSRKNTQSK